MKHYWSYFWYGVSSVFNVFGNMPTFEPTQGRTDADALRADWQKIISW